MSNADLVNYLNSIVAENTNTISNLNMQIANFGMLINGNIEANLQLQAQIDALNNKIPELTNENEIIIPQIIALIPPDNI